MLRLIRQRRAGRERRAQRCLEENKSLISKGKGSSPASLDSKKVFRQQPSSSSIFPNLTFATTISDDESESYLNVQEDYKADMIAKELASHQKLSEKEQEIQKMNAVLEELKLVHKWAMMEKEEQLSNTEHKLEETERVLSETQHELEHVKTELSDMEVELGEAYRELSDKESEFTQTKEDLLETKETLVIVSATLIQHQHELHDANEELQGYRNIKNGWTSFWRLEI